MEIRLRSTGEVMYEGEFRTRFAQNLPSNPLTQEWLNTYVSDPAGDIVFEGPQATGGTVYQYSQRAGVEQLDGKWYTKYILGPVFTDRAAQDDQPAQTAAEQETAYKAMKDAEQAKAARQTRDLKLKDLDWTQGKDIPESISAPAATLRQALRDVPTQAGFPWTIVWPDAP
jgi:hypothetical protein